MSYCPSCNHWKQRDPATNPAWGSCHSEDVRQMTSSSPDGRISISITRGDFGCAFWKQRRDWADEAAAELRSFLHSSSDFKTVADIIRKHAP